MMTKNGAKGDSHEPNGTNGSPHSHSYHWRSTLEPMAMAPNSMTSMAPMETSEIHWALAQMAIHNWCQWHQLSAAEDTSLLNGANDTIDAN